MDAVESWASSGGVSKNGNGPYVECGEECDCHEYTRRWRQQREAEEEKERMALLQAAQSSSSPSSSFPFPSSAPAPPALISSTEVIIIGDETYVVENTSKDAMKSEDDVAPTVIKTESCTEPASLNPPTEPSSIAVPAPDRSHSGSPAPIPPLVFCANRLVQRIPIARGLRLFVGRTVDKGWGLFTSTLIRRFSFVCEYVGEVVHEHVAEQRGRRLAAQGKSNYLYTHTESEDKAAREAIIRRMARKRAPVAKL